MDRTISSRPSERQYLHDQSAPPASPYSSAFSPSSAHAHAHMSVSDPFHVNRDPFLPGTQAGRGSAGMGSRAWPPTPGQQHTHPQHHHLQHHHHPPAGPQQLSPPPASQGAPLPPPPPLGMPPPLSYDSARRSSLGGAGSPPQYSRGPLEPSHALPPFSTRNMPPPSPPQMPASSHLRSAPPGPPTASPFSGARDLASNRSGMSISSILGGSEERIPASSPPSAIVHPTSTPQSIRPPSPGRARSSSMREGNGRGYREYSPSRAPLYRESSRASAEPRRENTFGSPPFRGEGTHSFRAFQPPAQDHPLGLSGHVPPRPISQPIDPIGLRGAEERSSAREPLHEHHRLGIFRQYGDQPAPSRVEAPMRQDRAPFANGVAPHAQERSMLASPPAERDTRALTTSRFAASTFGSPLRDEQASLFRPATNQPTSHPAPDSHRDVIDSRAHDMRRQLSRPSPPPSDIPPFDRSRNGYPERPMTLEEHQRMERVNSANRKESESSVHRAILNISPELNRKGRSSPLPQAVQGAQPRHIGPGGDNPGIKMEFGRMFSGLGSGVGSTPPIGASANGFSTPSRFSPARHLDGENIKHSAADTDSTKGASKAGARARKTGRRTREEIDRADSEGRKTPDLQRGNKRSKTTHPSHHHHHHVHPHHHHHHHHNATEQAVGGFNMLRFPSNPISEPPQQTPPQHHHHHHHHAHPGHHHHHQPRASVPPAKQPTTTVNSAKVLDQCASKPRKHMGSQLYTTEVSLPPAADTPLDAKLKFSSRMKAIPFFEGRENSTFTVRVPRYYLASSENGSDKHVGFEEICKRRQLWGAEIYSDDSDIVAAAVHSGWLKGDFGEYNEDIHDVFNGTADRAIKDEASPRLLESCPKQPMKVPVDHDAHITVLILPPLEQYASTNQHHIWSREWNKTHDGMSYMIHSIEFVDEGPASRFTERGASARKKRIAMEEDKRREAAAGLLMFATGSQGTSSNVVRVGA